jgi:predicted glutamate--cysteine ligase
VPIFANHSHYVRWMEEQLATGSMHNVRHLWTSVRPNGDDRPHDLNRIELRICDLIADPLELLAVTAFAELRLLQLLAEPGRFDPLLASDLSPEDLADLAAFLGSLDEPRHAMRPPILPEIDGAVVAP